jgi:hypothetical protein
VGDELSVEAMAIALRHSRATAAARTILVGIANHDGDGGAWPSMETLSVYGNVSMPNAREAVKRLVALGEISVDINGGGMLNTPEHMRTNLYKFLLKCPPNCDGTKAHKTLCKVCRKPLPGVHRRMGQHPAGHPKCDPLLPTDPPIAGEGCPPSSAGGELPFTPEDPSDIKERRVLNREGEAQADEDGFAEFFSANPIYEFVPCPARSVPAPCSLDGRGRCIDISRHPTEGETP